MSRLDNFKNRIHALTTADRINGGKQKTKDKYLANSIKNLKHGKRANYSHQLLRCVDCPYFFECDKRSSGYCAYLIEDLKKDRKLRRMLMDMPRHKKDNSDPFPFVASMYRINRYYIAYLKKYFR